LIEEILSLKEFKEKPPVLMDIGASGQLLSDWRKIAKFSIGIAFDADRRDIDYIETEKAGFLKLYSFNKIVAEDDNKRRFYLTKSPYCSSTLLPNAIKLKEWSFNELFYIKEKIELDCISLPTVLKALKIAYIDWFKTDSQGTDLRLFLSLGQDVISRIMVAEFEPGINDSYVNEDKMHAVMYAMEQRPFWLSDLVIKGPQRIKSDYLKRHFNRLDKIFLPCLLKKSAFWGEMSYMNNFENLDFLSKRNLLLGWVFATIKKQYGFALHLAHTGQTLYEDDIFKTLENRSITFLKIRRVKMPVYFIRKSASILLQSRIEWRKWWRYLKIKAG